MSLQQLSSPQKTKWAWTLGTFFGAGLMKPGPGTWGSAAGLVLWWGFGRYVPAGEQWLVCLAAAVVVTLIGTAASNVVARESGSHDPQYVVVDEVAGQLIAMIAAPLRWQALLAAFILFRVFDITKPFPIRRLERIRPDGAGIMLDDVGAGIYALIVVQLLLHLRWI